LMVGHRTVRQRVMGARARELPSEAASKPGLR
jgi:hypothetical protein